MVPVLSRDELGQLAEEFNAMARQLRITGRPTMPACSGAQRTSQATIDSFPDPVLVVDPEGRVEMANPAAQQLFGIAARPNEAQPDVVWQPPEGLRAAAPGGPAEPADLPAARVRPRPSSFASAARTIAFCRAVLPIRDPFGHTLGAAVLLQDVTRFRLLDQVKSDLVATVSHELKTPLTSVRLALHLLLEETVGPLTPKQTELLLDARDNAERCWRWSTTCSTWPDWSEGRATSTCGRSSRPVCWTQPPRLFAPGRRQGRRVVVKVPKTCRTLPPTCAGSDTPWRTCWTMP